METPPELGTIDLLIGGTYETEIADEAAISATTAGGIKIARIKREGDQVILESLNTKERIILKDGDNSVGRTHQHLDFFSPPERGRDFVSREHFRVTVFREDGTIRLKFVDLNSQNGTKLIFEEFMMTPTVEEKIRTAPILLKLIERGSAESIRDVAPDREFESLAICNDVDGELHSPLLDLYGRTEIATPLTRNNEDGIYINPRRRLIAGVDGLGGHPRGEIAAAFALVSVHYDLEFNSPVHFMAEKACRYLRRIVEWRKIPISPKVPPSATMAVAMQRQEGASKFIEGFNVGDYNVLILDLTAEKILYESVPQNFVTDNRIPLEDARNHPMRHMVTNAISPTGLQKPPLFFAVPIPNGSKVVTFVFSDGISSVLDAEEILHLAVRHRKRAAAKIVEEAKARRTDDNVSICQMFSSMS